MCPWLGSQTFPRFRGCRSMLWGSLLKHNPSWTRSAPGNWRGLAKASLPNRLSGVRFSWMTTITCWNGVFGLFWASAKAAARKTDKIKILAMNLMSNPPPCNSGWVDWMLEIGRTTGPGCRNRQQYKPKVNVCESEICGRYKIRTRKAGNPCDFLAAMLVLKFRRDVRTLTIAHLPGKIAAGMAGLHSLWVLSAMACSQQLSWHIKVPVL